LVNQGVAALKSKNSTASDIAQTISKLINDCELKSRVGLISTKYATHRTEKQIGKITERSLMLL